MKADFARWNTRVLAGDNWLCGWWNNQVGVAYFNQWMTNPWRAGDTDWHVMVCRNSGGNTAWLDGRAIGTSSWGRSYGGRLTINVGWENSDAEVDTVLIYDQHLSDDTITTKLWSLIGAHAKWPS